MAYGGYGGMIRKQTSGVGNRYGSGFDQVAPNRYEQAARTPSAPASPMQAPAPVQPAAPVYTGRIPSAPAPAAQAPAAGSYGQMLGGQPMAWAGAPSVEMQGAANPFFKKGPEREPANETFTGMQGEVGKLSPEDQAQYNALSQALYAVPDFKGRHEMNRMILSQWLMNKMIQQGQPEVDLSGSSRVADEFRYADQRLEDRLAAQGVSGSGVAAGAQANMAGSQAAAMGDFIRQQLDQRRRENLAMDNAFLGRMFQTQGQGLSREWEQQDEPGFWGDALGVLGGVAGSVIPGLGGLGNLFGSNQKEEDIQGYGAQAAGGGWY